MQIRHIVASETAPVFAVGAFEHDVAVWDFSERRKIGDFKTIMDYGGQRLAIYNRETPLLVAGAYNRYGICAYDLRRPNMTVWSRRDLKNPQVMYVSERLGLMSCSFGYRALRLLDATTGADIRKFSKAFTCYFGPLDDEVILAESFGQVWSASIKSGLTICRFPLQRGALHVAQAREAVLISDHAITDFDSKPITEVSPARLLCYTRDGRLLWCAQAAPHAHFLRVAWCPELSLWFAIEWPYIGGGPKKLKAYAPDGKLTHERIIGDCVREEFLCQGQCLVTSEHEVLELPTLNVLWRFGD